MILSQYGVREVWGHFKEAALRSQEGPVEALVLASIEKWAEHEAGRDGGPDRGLREALAASVAGASLVDTAIEKLAMAGRYNDEEREFLLGLNAEAAVRDLTALLKVSSLGDSLRNMINSPNAPTVIGGVGGALVGGGIGALKDDDNRARGALAYGVPGAAIGALAGHGYGQWRTGVREEQAKRVAQEAADALEKQHATHDWNYKLQQGREWGKAQDAAHALQAGLPAAEKVKSLEDAKRWHRNLFDSAEMYSRHSDKAHQEYAKHLRQQLHAYKDTIIEHASSNPESVHKMLIAAAGVDGGQKTLKAIVDHARMLHKNGN